MCKGCICMSCKAWESCPYFARCEAVEITECEQKHDCRWYCAESTKNNKEGEIIYEMV